MANYISDEEMAKLEMKSKKVKQPDFISDEEMNKISQETEILDDKPNLNVTGRGLLKGAIESLPIAGSMFGGAAGFASPVPGGALLGSGLGAAGGEALKQIGEKYLLGEDAKELPERIKDIGMEGLYGAAGEAGGQIIGKGIQAAGKGLIKARPTKINAEAIEQAMDELSKSRITSDADQRIVKATRGMLSPDRIEQGIESSLEQSPTIAGALTRKRTQPVYNLAKDTGEALFKETPNLQPSDVGYEFKQGLRSEIESRVKPIKNVYDKIQESTQFIEVNPKSLDRVSNNIINSEPFKSSPGYSMANLTASDLKNVKNVDQLKTLRSNIGKRLSNPNLDGAEKATLNLMYGKLSNLEQNTIMREAIKQARTGPEGQKIGSQLVGELKDANKNYKSVMEDLKLLGRESGVESRVNSIDNFLNKVDQIPDEKIVDTFFKPSNRQSLLNLEKLNPEGFESLKQSKLNTIRLNSEFKGQIDPAKLVRNLKDMEHDTRVVLFGEEGANNINHMKTVIDSLPNKMGPSGTPQGMEFKHLFSPSGWINEFSRMAQYKNLNKGQGFLNKAVGPSLIRNAPLVESASKGLIQTGLESKGAGN